MTQHGRDALATKLEDTVNDSKNSLDSFRLDGRTALVTGGSKGLGRSMALALAEAGADIALCSRNGDEAAEAAQEIARATGRKTLGVACDVTDSDSVRRLASECQAAL